MRALVKIAELEARVAELEDDCRFLRSSNSEIEMKRLKRAADDAATIRRLSDENAALREHSVTWADTFLQAQLSEAEDRVRELKDENAELRRKIDILREDVDVDAMVADYELKSDEAMLAAIYGTDTPECATPEKPEEHKDTLLTRWRNGKRYELTKEDAERFDEMEEPAATVDNRR